MAFQDPKADGQGRPASNTQSANCTSTEHSCTPPLSSRAPFSTRPTRAKGRERGQGARLAGITRLDFVGQSICPRSGYLAANMPGYWKRLPQSKLAVASRAEAGCTFATPTGSPRFFLYAPFRGGPHSPVSSGQRRACVPVSQNAALGRPHLPFLRRHGGDWLVPGGLLYAHTSTLLRPTLTRASLPLRDV